MGYGLGAVGYGLGARGYGLWAMGYGQTSLKLRIQGQVLLLEVRL